MRTGRLARDAARPMLLFFGRRILKPIYLGVYFARQAARGFLTDAEEGGRRRVQGNGRRGSVRPLLRRVIPGCFVIIQQLPEFFELHRIDLVIPALNRIRQERLHIIIASNPANLAIRQCA